MKRGHDHRMDARTRQEGAVAQALPRVTRSEYGYDVGQVDAFLSRAREAYGAGPDDPQVTAASIRSAAFDVKREGYSRVHVDGALDRLENAFSLREREVRIASIGEAQWRRELTARAQELLDRLDRGPTRRFRRERRSRRGYRVGDVDAFAELLVKYFRDDEEVSPDEVRTVVFRTARGGYMERQVDEVLDAVVEVMISLP